MSRSKELLIASHNLIQKEDFLNSFVEGVKAVAKVQRAKLIYNKYADNIKKKDNEIEISDFLNKFIESVNYNSLCHNKKYTDQVIGLIDLREERNKALNEVETKDYDKEFKSQFETIKEQIPILIKQITKILELPNMNKTIIEETNAIFRTINFHIEIIVGSKIDSHVLSESVNIYESLLSTAIWYMFDKLDECKTERKEGEEVEGDGTEELGEGRKEGEERGEGEEEGENKYLKYKNKYLKYKNKYLKNKKL